MPAKVFDFGTAKVSTAAYSASVDAASGSLAQQLQRGGGGRCSLRPSAVELLDERLVPCSGGAPHCCFCPWLAGQALILSWLKGPKQVMFAWRASWLAEAESSRGHSWIVQLAVDFASAFLSATSPTQMKFGSCLRWQQEAPRPISSK